MTPSQRLVRANEQEDREADIATCPCGAQLRKDTQGLWIHPDIRCEAAAKRWGPTPRRDWVTTKGERCKTERMKGTVQHITWNTTLPQVRVLWDNGSVGVHTITTLRKGSA